MSLLDRQQNAEQPSSLTIAPVWRSTNNTTDLPTDYSMQQHRPPYLSHQRLIKYFLQNTHSISQPTTNQMHIHTPTAPYLECRPSNWRLQSQLTRHLAMNAPLFSLIRSQMNEFTGSSAERWTTIIPYYCTSMKIDKQHNWLADRLFYATT